MVNWKPCEDFNIIQDSDENNHIFENWGDATAHFVKVATDNAIPKEQTEICNELEQLIAMRQISKDDLLKRSLGEDIWKPMRTLKRSNILEERIDSCERGSAPTTKKRSNHINWGKVF